jgi:uncharacterized protein (TIGR02147 family)
MSSVYSYTDYREFLKDELSSKRSRNASFSVRAAAARLGIGSGTLCRILGGARNIGPALLPAIASFLGLKTREAEYFALLVKFSRTANPGKKRLCYEKMIAMRGEIRQKIPEGKYAIFEQWHCLALHQLLRIVPDCADAGRLGALLDPAVSAARTRKAIDVLLRNGFIRRNERGGYSPIDTSLTTGETWRGVAIHGFQRTAAGMAALALDKFPKEERDFSTLTVSLSAERFAAAREILRKARQDLLDLDEKETSPERVYQMNFQFFPLSRIADVKRGAL